jgi:Lhr-like helicase
MMRKELHTAINNAIMKEFMFQGYNKHQALHAILELTEEPEAIKETLHGALDSYINYKKTFRIER